MRKIKLKFNSTKLKALFLCAVASVGLFYSCNQDDLHHHNHEHQSNFSAKKLSHEEALQVARKLNGLVNNGKHNTLLISEQSLSVANNSVDFSTVNLIESINGTKTYAFAVNDSNLEDNIIKNVILQEFPNEIVVKEVSYNMTESFKQQYYNGATDFKSFQGTVTFETVFGNPCPDDADPVSIGIPVGDDNDGNGGSGYGGYIPIGGFPDGGINNGGLFNSIGGGGSGGGGGGYAYLQCTNCSRTYGSRSEMDGSICAGYNYIIVISFSQNQNVVPNNSPCDPSTTLPVAEIEFVTKAREFQRNLTPEQRTWTQQNPTSYTQILNYLRNENWSNESEQFAKELIDFYNDENIIGEDDLKNKIRQAIANGITSTAEFTHKIFKKFSNLAEEYPSSITYINSVLETINDAASTVTNTNPQTCTFADLFNMWLFELGPNPININGSNTASTNQLKIQEGVNQARNIALSKIQNGDFSITNHSWTYGQGEFYDGMSNGNFVTAFLGSYSIKVTISSTPNGYQLNFQVSNTSSWDSATRFRIDNDGNGVHDGVFPNTYRNNNNDLSSGGNFTQNWNWSETH